MFSVLHISAGPVDCADEDRLGIACTSSRGEIWTTAGSHRNYPSHFKLWGEAKAILIGESQWSAGSIGQAI